MAKRYLQQINDRSYVIEQFDESVLEKNPYAAVWFVPPNTPHKSTFFVLTYIEEGEADIDLFSRRNGEIKTVAAKARDMLIIAPGDIYNYHVNPKTRYRHKDIYVFNELMRKCCDLVSEDLYETIIGGEYPEFFRLSAAAELSISEMMTSIVFEPISETNSAIHKSVVTYILGQYIATREYINSYPKWIKKLLGNLDKEYFLSLPIEEMVKDTGFSHGYVSSQFKRYMGVSLKKYVNKSKLSVAAAILLTSDCSIEDIVERLGFNTASNFINLFKAEFGTTPARYRKSHRSKSRII